jgi:hypothetical protein
LSNKSSHSIKIEDEKVETPLSLKGIISYFNVRTPTVDEIENLQHIELTSEAEWDPHSSHFEELEQESLPHPKANIGAINIDHVEYCDILATQANNISRQIKSTFTKNKKLFIQDHQLAARWAISLKDAAQTVQATTQKFIRNALHPIERRFCTKNMALRYNQLCCHFTSDTFFSNVKSIFQHSCAQLFMTDFRYGKIVPMKAKSEAGYALKELIQDVGIPKHLHTDGAKELTMGIWKQVCKEAGIKSTTTEKNSPWQN